MDKLRIPEDQTFPFQLGDDGTVLRWKPVQMRWETVKPSTKADGYQVVVWVGPAGRKTIYMHRLVWILNYGAIAKDREIDHVDGVKSNNVIENLSLVSRGENMRLARERLGNWSNSRRKITEEQVAVILSAPSDRDWKAMADELGVHKGTLLNMRSRAKKQELA